MPASAETPNASGILTEQVLIRISKEEYDAWTKAAEANHVHVNILVRRVMGIALRIQPVVARMEELVAAAKRKRAEHMRSFRKVNQEAEARKAS